MREEEEEECLWSGDRAEGADPRPPLTVSLTVKCPFFWRLSFGVVKQAFKSRFMLHILSQVWNIVSVLFFWNYDQDAVNMVVKIYGSCYDGFHRPVDCNDTGDHDKPRVQVSTSGIGDQN